METAASSPASVTLQIEPPWLQWEDLRAVVAAISDAGFEARIVGGAVRDTLRALRDGGRPPEETDVDLATTAPPAAVVRAAETAGLEARPTGISHGTVTVLSAKHAFETTTLRSDINTDGRHAEVAFSADWVADAQRRDFTVNAIYCDLEGRIFDPLNGLSDLADKKLRFIGDPRSRIREDYLRTLRLFRLSATMPEMKRDPAAERAASAEHSGLVRLSAERVRNELFRLLTGEAAFEAYEGLRRAGVLVKLLPFAPFSDRLKRTIEIERRLGLEASPTLRLVSACVAQSSDVTRLAHHLRLSNHQQRCASAIVAGARLLLENTQNRDLRVILYQMSEEHRSRAVVFAHATSGSSPDDGQWKSCHDLARNWTTPEFPISAQNLIDLGISPGPQLGKLLKRLEREWCESGFSMTREHLLALAGQFRK